MKIATCNLSIIPLRAEASHRSEIVSQVLFGESFEIITESEDFVHVKLLDIGYEGWVQKHQFVLQEEDLPVCPYIVDVAGAVASSKGHNVRLLHGTRLPGNKFIIGTEWYNVTGPLRKPQLEDFASMFPLLVNHYKNTPYLWGGCSQSGIDCSGFSQLIYRHFAVALPRDAWQQAEQGQLVDFLTEIKLGDLAFFDNDLGHITHVGIMLDTDTIIHASARVRIDKMDSEGIFNAELNKYTHRLRIIKRYF